MRMRTEQEMMALIRSVAQGDERIRAVYMNGSRANPAVRRDRYQDYDVVYVVTELASFQRMPGWIDVFGKRIFLQEPSRLDRIRGLDVDEDCYTYLMLFADGNRIDLTLETVDSAVRKYGKDSLTVLLLDKDGMLDPIEPPSDRSYWIQRPLLGDFEACTNNFWWCMQNVAKGIARRELPYARSMFERVIRPELDRVIGWYIASQHAYRINLGAFGRWMDRYLTPEQRLAHEKTYADATYACLWEAAFAACALFREMGHAVAQDIGAAYPKQGDEQMTAYLHRVRAASQDDERDVGPVV